MTQKTLGGVAGDFLIHMESPQKCLTYGHVTAPSSGTGDGHVVDNVVAYPLKANNVLAKAGEEASVVAFLIAGEPISLADGIATSGVPYYTILSAFDGVVLNKDALPAKDCQATQGTFDKDAIETALELLGAKFVTEPDNQSEQTS